MNNGKPQGFTHPGAATDAASNSTNVTFALRGRKERWVCWRSPALFTWLNNSSVAWCHPTAGGCSISTETKSAPSERSHVPMRTPKEVRSPPVPTGRYRTLIPSHPSSPAPAATASRRPPYLLSPGSWWRLPAPAWQLPARGGTPAAPPWPVSGPGAGSPPAARLPSPAGPVSARRNRTES